MVFNLIECIATPEFTHKYIEIIPIYQELTKFQQV